MSDLFEALFGSGSDAQESDDDEDRDDFDELDAELGQGAMVFCPYCGESVEVLVDPAGGGTQAYVEDCEVCCQPWAVRVDVGNDGVPTVTVTTLDDG